MSHPAEVAGRRSAAAFRDALGMQLERCCEMASSAAFIAAEEEGIAFHLGAPFRSSRMTSQPRPGAGEAREAAAPAYSGGATSSNGESWMKFAQAPRDQGGLGLTKAQASGVVGNLEHESGKNIAPHGVTGDRGTAHGAAQWRLGRFANLKAKSAEWGVDWRTTEAQQRFMRHELDTSESRAYAHLLAAKTPEQAADAFNRHYERSADPGAGRRSSARRLFGQSESPVEAAKAAKPVDRASAGGLIAAPGRNPDLQHVSPRLREIMAAAATHLPEGYTMRVNEGYNAHGHAPRSQHHGPSGALDVQIFDPQGKPIPNRGRDTSGMYTRLGRAAYGEMMARYPELNGRLAHGAAFGVSRGSNVADLMHFDLGGERGNLAPHLSKLGALPGERYGEPKQQKTAEDLK